MKPILKIQTFLVQCTYSYWNSHFYRVRCLCLGNSKDWIAFKEPWWRTRIKIKISFESLTFCHQYTQASLSDIAEIKSKLTSMKRVFPIVQLKLPHSKLGSHHWNVYFCYKWAPWHLGEQRIVWFTVRPLNISSQSNSHWSFTQSLSQTSQFIHDLPHTVSVSNSISIIQYQYQTSQFIHDLPHTVSVNSVCTCESNQ